MIGNTEKGNMVIAHKRTKRSPKSLNTKYWSGAGTAGGVMVVKTCAINCNHDVSCSKLFRRKVILCSAGELVILDNPRRMVHSKWLPAACCR